MKKPRFTTLPFFVYPVRDMARARRFYTQVLGLRETANWNDEWIEFDVGRGTVALSTVMQSRHQGGSSGAVALECANFEDTVAWLRHHHVSFALEPSDTGVCQFAVFEDTEGNRLVLHRRQRRKQKP